MTRSQGVLDLPGGRLAYDIEGPDGGPLVVAVPGMGDTRGTFRFLAPLLAGAGYRVVTMDVRGHGESSVDWPDYRQRSVGEDILALIDDLGGPAMLIGNSSGAGAVAFAAAPERVSSLVLVSSFASPPRLSLLLRAAQGLVLRSPRLWSIYFRSLFATVRPDDHDTYVRDLRRILGGRGRMAAVRGLVAPGEAWTAVAGDIRCPVLVINGTKDPDFPDPAAEARAAQALLTGADQVAIEMVEGAGHYPQVEYPDRTFAAIQAFEARQRA